VRDPAQARGVFAAEESLEHPGRESCGAMEVGSHCRTPYSPEPSADPGYCGFAGL
jgi:hypothetical protein